MQWEKPKKVTTRRAVAYYRHSAQDRQENSIEIQQDQVRKFAADNGIEIIKEFADHGESGLVAKGRDSFNEMIHGYVEGKKADFELVLALDVSRWGRFQETDIAAYYTGVCLLRGIQVVYSTLGFPKGDALMHGMQLSFERFRAAAYSLELSGKVWKGCAKIASNGFWAGGSAPYGMCRVLLDEQRRPLQVLAPGEHKAIHNQRVTLGLGDEAEVATVRNVFNLCVLDGVSPPEIASQLNAKGCAAPGGREWTAGAVSALLRNEIYAGAMVWNKTSKKMKGKSHSNPENEWVKSGTAFEAVVAREIFDRAREIMATRAEAARYRYSSVGMLAGLRGVFDRYGTVSSRLVAAARELVSPATYGSRFHGVDMAYQGMFGEAIDQRRAQVIEAIKQAEIGVQLFNGFVVIEDYFSLAIQPSVPIARGYEAYWVFQPDQRVEVDLTIGVPLSCPQDFDVLGYLVFPRLLFQKKIHIHSGATERAELHACTLIDLINELRR